MQILHLYYISFIFDGGGQLDPYAFAQGLLCAQIENKKRTKLSNFPFPSNPSSYPVNAIFYIFYAVALLKCFRFAVFVIKLSVEFMTRLEKKANRLIFSDFAQLYKSNEKFLKKKNNKLENKFLKRKTVIKLFV